MVALNPKRVLVPTDFSDEASGAVEEALQLVEHPDDLTILHVAPAAVISEAELYANWSVISDESRADHLRHVLHKKFPDHKFERVHFEVRFGSPATEIAKYAENEEIDLIVLPSHGRTGLARLMIGSVAERVIRMAHCPVLVLRE
jgi:nucleotide-binding universal stress UspA family protein